MIRAIRTLFNPDGINKHALILCSLKEGIGKSYFCEFLCPLPIIKYYTSSSNKDSEKDLQKALIRNFIINLEELHQLNASPEFIKGWLSQRYINVRFPFQEKETFACRIASFLGSSNNIEFLRSEMGYSRWIGFEVQSIDFLGKEARYVVERSWEQAYHLYKLDEESGELSMDEVEELETRSDSFTNKSTEAELIIRNLLPSTKEEGEFMTATDILIYLQNIVGITIRLNTKLVGSALRKAGFERINHRTVKGPLYGYFVKRV